MEIGIINGPNLNLLGKREPEIYGEQSFEDYFEELKVFFKGVGLEYFQSNSEGALIDVIHDWGFKKDGVIINAGAYTHTSIAISDAIKGVTAPFAEVHISDIYKREKFRHVSYLKSACSFSIIGQGLDGYRMAIQKFYSK